MNVALLDIVRPYFFAGMDLGSVIQEALALLHVDEYDTAWDDDAVLISGVARIDSNDSRSPFFSTQAGGGTGVGSSGSSNDMVKWEWHDVAIRFRITIARRAANALPLAQLTSPDVSAVLRTLGLDTGPDRSDYPNTQFRLELMFELVTVTFPRLIGARLDGWVLVPDPDNREVKISLPRVLLILTQDSAADTSVDLKVGSFGAETLDDHDPGIANLLRMNPPYALIPGEQFGFGFRKAVLDLSSERTPPDILDQFGVGEDWQGIYLPEVRIFASTQRSAGVAFNIGARDLLIGLHPTPGLWGEFNIDIDLSGDRLIVGLRLYGVSGARLDPQLISKNEGAMADRYIVNVPSTAGPETENYVMFVDISSGAAPFTITAVSGEEHPTDLSQIPDNSFFDDSHNHPENISVLQRMRLFSHDQRVVLRITSRNPAQRRVVVLDVYPDAQTSTSMRAPSEAVPEAHLAPVISPAIGSVVIESQNDTEVVLRITPPDGTLTVGGENQTLSASGTARVTVAPNSSHEVIATWGSTGQFVLKRFSVYFAHDFPSIGGDVGTTSSSPGPVGGLDSVALNDLVQAFHDNPGTVLRVDAYASREAGSANSDHNIPLARRRAAYLVSLLVARGINESQITGPGIWSNQDHPSSDASIQSGLIEDEVPGNHSAEAEMAGGHNPNYQPERFRAAFASLLKPRSTTETFRGTLYRDAVPEPGHNEPPAPQGQHPDFLRHIGGTVRFERDFIPVAAELRLTVDFQTAHEQGLERFRNDINVIGPGLEDPDERNRLPQGDPNPEDGVVECRLAITYDSNTGTFAETLVARAGAGDRDGLWSWGNIPPSDSATEPESNGWRDLLGLYFTLAPLLSESAADAAAGGGIVPLVVNLSIPVAITVLGVAHVLRFIHYGVELNVRHDEDEIHASLLFDVESDIWLNLKVGSFVIVTNRQDKPIKIRYKAIGFALDAPPGQPVRFLPVFDSSRGYTIDLADSGSLKVLPALGDRFGDIIQVLGARIARTNPLNMEVDLGFGVDLGVVTIDRFGFRLPLHPLGSPSITAIGVGINIPEVLKGRGYLQIQETGFTGQLDLTLPSVGVRIAAGLTIRTVTENDRSATATLVSLAAELPTGLPVGGTGLAIFGFLGLFAMHHARTENPSARNPALDWLVNIEAGDPTDLRGWAPRLDQWAFGVGLVAGTIEGGTVLNLKGMLVLELPGPRVLLFVKARILREKPATRGTDAGTLSAVVDITPQRILIGIEFEYHIEEVLDLMIPAEAGFFYDPPIFPPEHFYVDVGTIAQPATAKVLQLFDATAYFMVHGDGIPDFPLGSLQGFSVALGFRASFTWGNTDVRLYLRIAAGFDVGVGFNPLFFAGRVFIDGELRLFIVSIEAHGELKFRSDGLDTLLEGRICGRVSFFFFSVKGCVGFAIGTDPAAPPVPDPVRDMILQSRSPAIMEGTGVDRGIDTVLCHGTIDGSVPTMEMREGDSVVQRPVLAPIDAIPLVQFEVGPEIASGATIDGQLSSGLPPGFGGWQKRGENYLRYMIRSVELKLVSMNGLPVADGTAPVTEGPRPYTWRHPAQLAGSDGLPVELALLDWKPTNIDKALLQGPALDSTVDTRWSHVCKPVAAADRVLWTFRFTALGTSPEGWELNGEAWPDKPGTTRSLPVDTKIRVSEVWRTDTFLDGLLPPMDASVVGISFPCPKKPKQPVSQHTELVDRTLLSLSSSPPTVNMLTKPSMRERKMGRSSELVSSIASIPLCVAKVLQAPYELLAESLVIADDGSLRQALMQLDEERMKALRDVIRLSGGPFVDLSLLIFARLKMVVKGLIRVRAFSAGGVELGDVSVSFQLITSDAQLPPRWVDTSGPWWDDVLLARSFFSALADEGGGWGQYLVSIKLPTAALQVDIGVAPLSSAIHDFGMNPPSFYLAVIDALSRQETIREQVDSNQAAYDTDGLENALGDQQHALLFPNAQYEVRIIYDGEIGKKREEPSEDEDPNEIVAQRTVTDQQATRTFYTDSEPPRNLEPWMLAQFPSPGELYHFYEDPVVVAFATNDVLQLFAAYGKDLRAVARAASFRGSEGTPEAPSTHLMVKEFFRPISGAILSPWEATVRRRIGHLSCGEFDPDADRHGLAVLPFLLDPLTDYVLDLEMLNPDGTVSHLPPLKGEVGDRPLYRQGFSTSRYANREAFAEEVRSALVKHKQVNNLSSLLALSGSVTDELFDRALLDAGIEPITRPSSPRLWVLWNTAPVAEPTAILIETPEPVWRFRQEPTPEYDEETGQYILRWSLADHLWLFVDELVRNDETVLVSNGGDFVRRATGTKIGTVLSIAEFRTKFIGPKSVPPLPLPIPPESLVDGFVHDASGTRTLVILKPGVRGKTVSLGIARELNPLLDTDESDIPIVLCEVDLGAPPWEELS